jgi:hypothetical protein
MPSPTVTPQHELKVGSPDKNFVSFEIAATEAAELSASIDIPCGEATSSRTYLCGDAQLAQLDFLSDPLDKIDGSVTRQSANVAWQSDRFPLQAGEKVKIKITGFNPEGGGNASLNLKIWDDPDAPPLYDQTTPVSVSLPPGPAIIYFDVRPTNVLQGDEVKISSYTSGAKTVTLSASDNPVTESESLPKDGGLRNTYVHTPQVPTTYHLEAWRDKPGGSTEAVQFADRSVFVTVEPRGNWYTRDLLINSLREARVGQHRVGQLFYPTLLLAAKDLSGSTPGNRLYGIFVRQGTKDAGLWSSSSGFDGWRWEADVPEGMGESPGVIHKQALWLIGGSSADPLGPVSNRVCWYYKNKDKKMEWKEWDEDGSERKDPARVPAPRSCHACAVFKDKVWVLGGLSEQNIALADVWTCSADPASGNFTAAWTPSQPLPHPKQSTSGGRCMSAAAVTPTPPRLWLYGGATDPYNFNETFDELWWTQDGNTWAPFDLPPDKKGKPLGATLLYGSDEDLHLVGNFVSEGGKKSDDYALTDPDVKPPGWSTASPSPAFKWLFPQTDLFLIRSVSFGERWIFWPVYQYMAKMKNYDTVIYNAPRVS